MKLIIKIAQAELRYLFYSPIAWFVIIAFLLLCGTAFVDILPGMALNQEIALEGEKFKDWGKPLTAFILGMNGGLFATVIQYLFLFIPLISMGVISRESVNGTASLLYSSPIRLRQIVLGKYFGLMLYNLLLVAIIGVFLVAAASSIQYADKGLLISAALGFYILTCTYGAIGMFMSSLTNYPVLAAMSTFLVLALLNYIGMFWQEIDIVRDLTYFLAISGRSEKIISGLIVSKDIFYFLLIVVMFIAFTIVHLRAKRISRPWFVHAGRYVLIVSGALLMGYISSRPSLTRYWDVTAIRSNTIAPETQKIVESIGAEALEVTLYTNLLGIGAGAGLPANRNNYLSTPWEPYLRFKPDIQFRYEYYYDVDRNGTDSTPELKRDFDLKLRDEAEVLADKYYNISLNKFKSPEEIGQVLNTKSENYRLVMELKYKGRRAFVRTFDDPSFWPSEAEIGAALKKLLLVSVPKIYFITGNFERSILKNGEREYSFHSTFKLARTALVNRGFECDTISLENRDIPNEATAVVLSDPKSLLSGMKQDRLKQYIDRGGNLIILGEPGKQSMLNSLLAQLNIRLMDGQLVQPTKNYNPDRIRPYATQSYKMLSLKAADTYSAFQLKDTRISILMPGASAVDIIPTEKFDVVPLFITHNEAAWLKRGEVVNDSATIQFEQLEGDTVGPFPTVVALTRKVNKKEQRIIVAGDADFLSNLRLVANGDFVEASYSWMSEGLMPVYASRTPPKDVLLSISWTSAAFLKTALLWILPILLTCFAVILLIRRKRK